MYKILLENISDNLSCDGYVLMVGLGFDSRCLSILKHFPKNKASQIIGILNIGYSGTHESNVSGFHELGGATWRVIGANAQSVIDVADELVVLISDLVNQSMGSLLVDITSLSHELLVVLLGVLHNIGVMNKTTLLYVGASEYSFNTSSDAMWLSRGVSSIRSILGFPGTMLPSKKLHLVVLAGFEVERASGVIAQYEPASMSIGLGKKDQSVSEAHYDRNKHFFDRLTQFVKEQDRYTQEVQHFEFSCIDPLQTKNDLLTHISRLKRLGDYNIVICPLNTKLSTVGVVLAVLCHPEIQICYAVPEEYNTEGYAKPGTEATIVLLENL